jgi:peptidylamidoglycolate lyase
MTDVAELFSTVAAGFVLGACAGPLPSGAPQPGGQETTAGDYSVVHGWPQVPAGELLGQVSGIGVDSRANVFVFRRADRSLPATTVSREPIGEPTVWLFEGQSGRLLQRWGAHQFAMPHGLTVDRQDNLWLTDIALHEVFKYSHDGVQLLTLGTRGIPGSDSAHFDGPSDVAVGAEGSIYVADGYGNSRVVEFSAEGRYIREWGRKGSGPGEFTLPHSIAMDALGRLYVADRGNARVQIFDSTGRFLREWRNPALGRPWAVRVASDGSSTWWMGATSTRQIEPAS